jgi:CheY-like chemotaxis protein
MYDLTTNANPAVHTTDAVATCGRILVIDDDRAFGGFMIGALESRGHFVDWAGCIADGMATLYANRYDLVIIDVRLPDGSGLDFLRAATDEGVMAGSAAIILTGRDDFDEPSDIRVFRKPLELDPFLDRMGVIIAHTQKRRATAALRPPRPRATGSDRTQPAKPIKIELVLYTSAASEKCQKAIRAVRNVLDRYDTSQVNFSICELSGRPSLGEADAVVFTPTLVKRGPGPRTWIVGNIDQPDLLVDLLEVSGVDLKK